MSEWRRETVRCDDADLEQVVQERAQALESGFSDDDLLALIRAKGVSDTSRSPD